MKTLHALFHCILISCLILAVVLVFSPGVARAEEDPTLADDLRALAIDAEYTGRGILKGVVNLGVKLPIDIAKDVVARSGLSAYVLSLPFSKKDKDVKNRILTAIIAKDFVPEVVPFLLAIKDLYSLPEDAAKTNFDAHLRQTFSSAENIPGFEHSMFKWEQEKKTDEALKRAFNRKLIVDLLRFYDLLFLQHKRSVLDKEFAEDAKTIQQAKSMVRKFVEKLLNFYAPKNDEIKEAADKLLNDNYRHTALTRALIDYLRIVVEKHYQMFSQNIQTAAQLKGWMKKQYFTSDGAALRNYLTAANTKRRYVFHGVVDGLQGHLLKALAAGDSENPFIKSVYSDYDLSSPLHTQPPRHSQKEELFAGAGHNISFLKTFAAKGFSHKHYLPHFKRVFATKSAGLVNSGVSTTPTISVRNLPIVKTGATVAGPGSTGLPNFHFCDRKGLYRKLSSAPERAYYFFGNDALLLPEITEESGMKTVFERLQRINTMNCSGHYDQGADYSLDGLLALPLGDLIRDFGEQLCVIELQKRAQNEHRLRQLRAKLLKKMGSSFWRFTRTFHRIGAPALIAEIADLETRSFPQYLLLYDTWPDHFAHFTAPFADEIISPSGELNRMDFWMGKIEEAYRAAGVYDRTLFAVAGDHGLANSFYLVQPEDVVFEALRNRASNPIDLIVEKISSDEGEGPKLTDRMNPRSIRGFDVVIASTAGGNYMMDFFNDQDKGWSEQPLYKNLTHLSTIKGLKGIDIIEEIRTLLADSLDYLVVREEKCSPEEAHIRLVATRKGKRADELVHRRGERIFYEISNADLLGVNQETRFETLREKEKSQHQALLARCLKGAEKSDPLSWCTEEEWRLLASFTNRPGAIDQIAHLYDLDLAGTINLFPLEGLAYNSTVPGRHAGELFHEKDAFLGFWGAPVNTGEPLRTAVIGSLPVTVYEYLTGRKVNTGEDGWGFESLSDALFEKGVVAAPTD